MNALRTWLLTHAIAVAFGAFAMFALYRGLNARAAARTAAEITTLTRARDTLRVALAHAEFTRDRAIDSARATTAAVLREASSLDATVHTLPPPTLPAVQLTPSGDSVTLALVDWRAHLAQDSVRDSVLNVAVTIVERGIPAIRDVYETALAKDSVRIVVGDSLTANAEARAKLWHDEATRLRENSYVERGLAVLGIAFAFYAGMQLETHR